MFTFMDIGYNLYEYHRPCDICHECQVAGSVPADEYNKCFSPLISRIYSVRIYIHVYEYLDWCRSRS